MGNSRCKGRWLAGLAASLGLFGCAVDQRDPAVAGSGPAFHPSVVVEPDFDPVYADEGDGARELAPLAAIAGGTLVATRDGRYAVMSDAAAHAVRVVDLEALALHAEVRLREGDEPGRLAEDGAGRVHVSLRRGGAVVTFDPDAPADVLRRPVCAAPRGIAWEPALDALHVACAGGELVTLPAAAGDPTRVLSLDPDLRDVVVDGDRLFVSRLRSAEVLVVDATGAVVARVAPTTTSLLREHRRLGDEVWVQFGAAVAWRMVAGPEGPLVSYQRFQITPVSTAPGGYGGSDVGPPCTQPILHAALARVAGGELLPLSGMAHATLPVDVAVSPDGSELAFAFAGNTASSTVPTSPPVAAYARASFEDAKSAPCVDPLRRPGVPLGRAISVAYDPLGRLLIQVTSPPRLVVGSAGVVGGGIVALGTGRPYEAGHFIFHAATPSGLACASCHPEGGDDGAVWRFPSAGPRRTQALWGGILDTAPFHWDGTLESLGDVLHSTFSGRMSGPELDPEEVVAVEHFIDQLQPPPASAPGDPEAVERGRVLFESERASCSTCHTGALGTDNIGHVVMGANAIQTPPLVGLSVRPPYMHDGCAPDLRDAILACGTPAHHGGAALLTEAELDDLVAYLSTH